jgi:hypothetical protein
MLYGHNGINATKEFGIAETVLELIWEVLCSNLYRNKGHHNCDLSYSLKASVKVIF